MLWENEASNWVHEPVVVGGFLVDEMACQCAFSTMLNTKCYREESKYITGSRSKFEASFLQKIFSSFLMGLISYHECCGNIYLFKRILVIIFTPTPNLFWQCCLCDANLSSKVFLSFWGIQTHGERSPKHHSLSTLCLRKRSSLLLTICQGKEVCLFCWQ